MEPVIKKLTSRKFLLALLNVGLVLANELANLGIPPESLAAMSVPIVGWILGESALDRERIKATQIENLRAADIQMRALAEQAQGLLNEKDAIIDQLSQLIDAADGPDTEDN